MKTLLSDRFSPLTHQVGFVEASFENTLEVFLKWQSEIGAEFGRYPRHELVTASLAKALPRLEPLTTPPTKVLLMETQSRWTAFFDNGLRASDPETQIGYLCTIIPSRGVVAHYAPDRSQTKDRNALRIYGIVSLRIFGPRRTQWLNQERAIVAMNDGGTWLFFSDGIEQPFEEPDRYRAPEITDRFTGEMLARYCDALGIKLFDEAFYGTKTAVVTTIQKLQPGAPVMSLREAHARSS